MRVSPTGYREAPSRSESRSSRPNSRSYAASYASWDPANPARYTPLFTSSYTAESIASISGRSAGGYSAGAPSRWKAVHSRDMSTVICAKPLVTTAPVGTSTIAGTVMPPG